MPTDQPATPNLKLRWLHPTPGRLLVILLAVEGALLMSEHWFPKGCAVLIAVAVVGLFLILMLLWFCIALLFRKRFQFSIRSLLVLTIAVAIPSSWLAVEMKKAREQREAVDALLKMGGIVLYQYDYDAFGNAFRAQPPPPSWWRNALGNDFFINVNGVLLDITDTGDAVFEKVKRRCWPKQPMFPNTPITDVALEEIQNLPHLLELNLDGAQITDRGLRCLNKLEKLQNLRLAKTSVTGVGFDHLKGMKHLNRLVLFDTKVTDSGLAHLQGMSQLNCISLRGTQITDAGLEYLKELSQLRGLEISQTKVTDAGVAKLQKALPNCKIVH